MMSKVRYVVVDDVIQQQPTDLLDESSIGTTITGSIPINHKLFRQSQSTATGNIETKQVSDGANIDTRAAEDDLTEDKDDDDDSDKDEDSNE
jgi:hypothetical protein